MELDDDINVCFCWKQTADTLPLLINGIEIGFLMPGEETVPEKIKYII